MKMSKLLEILTNKIKIYFEEQNFKKKSKLITTKPFKFTVQKDVKNLTPISVMNEKHPGTRRAFKIDFVCIICSMNQRLPL